MKKILLTALAAMVMTVGASAQETTVGTFFDYKQEIGIGYDLTTSDYTSMENQNGININGKLLKTVAVLKGGQKIAVGLTINGTYVPSVEYTSSTLNDTQYYIDFLPTASIEVMPKLDISAMIGYTMGERSGDSVKIDYSGLTYGLGTSYEVAPQWRVNLQMLQTNIDADIPSVNQSVSYKKTSYVLGVGYNF